MPLALLNHRWRAAERGDIKPGIRVMLPSGRRGSVVSIHLEDPMLVMVDVDGRLPTDPPVRLCQALCDLRVES